MTTLLENLPASSAWLIVLAKITALLAAAWMLHWLLLERNPRWRVMLWRSAMAGLILLPVLEVAMPAVRVEVPAPPALQIRYVTVPAAEPGDEPARPHRPYGLRPGAYDLATADATRPSLLDWAKTHTALLLVAGWGLVATVLMARTGTLLLRVRRIVRNASPAPQSIASRLRRITEDLQCNRNVALRLTAALVSPFLTRILRPVILLPEKMTSPERHGELDGILAHELAHVRGNDLVWLLLAGGLSCVLWFHPLLWRMATAHSRACEEVCDAVAAEYVGGAPAYSGILARVALELMADAPADGGVGMIRAANILQRVRLLKRGIQAAALGRRVIVTSLAIGGVSLLVLGSLKIAYADRSRADGAISKPSHSTSSNERKPVMASIKREGSRVWVEGLANQAVGRVGPESQMRLMEILLKHRGQSADARELMVLSGDAFNLCHPAHWQGGYSQLCIPTDPLANAARAYGYSSRWLNSNLSFYQINKLPTEQKRQTLDEFHQAIGKQIEAGRPVLMGGAYGLCGSWRVVAGVDMDEQQLCYVGGERPYDWVDIHKDAKVAQFGFWDEQVRGTVRDGFMGGWESNAAFLLGDKTQTPSPKDQMIGALKLAVDLFQDREHDYFDSGRNYLGRRAYEEWAHDWGLMSDLPDFQAAKATADPKATFPWYSIDSMALEVDTIVRGRTAAAEYLESRADLLPKAAASLKAAAAHYRKEVALTKEAFGTLLSGDPQACEKWLSDKEVRKAGGKAIWQIMAQEEAAIREITEALEAEKIDTSNLPRPPKPQPPVSADTGSVPGTPAGAASAPPEPLTVRLKGHEYTLVWLGPGQLSKADLLNNGRCRPRSADGIYSDHVDPLYNIHCELTQDEPMAQLDKRLKDQGKSWPQYWQELAAGLAGKVDTFALVAYSDGNLAGHIRFFPATLAHLRTGGTQQAQLLLIGAACVDVLGTEHGLDAELLRQVVRYAGRKGFAAVQAVAWSDVIPYAMWGESLPISTYESTGFRRHQAVQVEASPLKDMLSGSHGPQVRKLVQTAMDGGMTAEQANTVYLVQLDLGGTQPAGKGAATATANAVPTPANPPPSAPEGVQVTVTVAMPAEKMVSKAKVKREDGKVWIAGAENLEWNLPDGRHENTVMRSLTAALQMVGEDVTYEYMMGISGAAFRIQVFHAKLCPSSPHSHCGVNCQDPAIKALPYTAAGYGYPKDDPDGVRLTRQVIVDSIDRGYPVAFGSEETGLIVGYADGGNVLLGRPPYNTTGPGFQEIKNWPWGFTILKPRAGAPSKHETVVESLKRAVQLANRDSSDDKRYLCGWTAYAKWIDTLENGTELADVKPGDPEGKLLGNAFIYLCLLDARTCAAQYLRSIESEFQPKAREHVTAAAKLYEQIAAKLDAGHVNAPFPWDLRKSQKPYTAEMRKGQAKTLREACDLERKAIEELKGAIEAEEKTANSV